MRLNRFRLRTRIYFGFGLLVALLLGVAAFGSYGLSIAGREIGTMVALEGNVRRVQDIQLQLEVIRRGLTRYRIDADGEALRNVTDATARAAKLLADSAQYTLSDQRRAIYNGTAEKLRATTTQADHFVSLIGTGLGERKKLLAIGATLDVAASRLADMAAADGIGNDAAEAVAVRAPVRAAQIASLRFLPTLDPDALNVFKQAVAQANQAVAVLQKDASPPIKAALQALAAALVAYTETFGQVSSTLTEGEAVYAEQIRPAIREMQSAAVKASESLILGFDTASQNATSVVAGTYYEQLGLSAGGVVIGLVLAVLIASSIIRPVSGMTAAMTKLAAGDSDSEVPARDNTDEIGEMARAVEVFRQQAIENTRFAQEREQDRQAKERRQVAMDRHTQDFGESVSGVMASFVAAANAMRQAASEVNDGARQTRTSTSSTVEGAMSSSRDLNSVAAAAEEMAASIDEISKQVAHVTVSVAAAVDRATETDTKVAGLSEAADRIGDVVRIITDIAGQTNLLALNATIEAARAGEAGKGFAVVAGEVKALASQTARATEQIGTQIVAIRNATGEAVNAVREVGSAIGRVETVATAIAAAVEQQAAATREITGSVQMVTATTSSATEAMRQVLSIAETTDTSSAAALQASDEVGKTAEVLRREVTDFLTAMSRGDDTERRRYERIPGGAARATLRFDGQPAMEVSIIDMSRGGLAVRHSAKYPAGADLEILLPGAAAVRARIVRSTDGRLALSFRQDSESLARIDRALDIVAQGAARAAA